MTRSHLINSRACAIFALMILSVPAYGFEVIKKHSYHVLVPSDLRLHLQPSSTPEHLACQDIFQKMKSSEPYIERCLNGATQPRTYCKLLKRDLERSLKSTSALGAGSAEDQFKQVWAVTLRAQSITSESMHQYAGENDLFPQQVIDAKMNLNQLQKISIKAPENSYTALLQKSDILDWRPAVNLWPAETNQLRVETTDALTACELLAGTLEMTAKVNVQYHYRLIKSEVQGNRHWQWHRELEDYAVNFQEHSQELPVFAGFMIAQYEQMPSSRDDMKALIREYMKVHLDITQQNVRVKPYKHRFQLFKHLPQQKFVLNKLLEVHGGVGHGEN